MADISNVINVSLLADGQLAQSDNMNITAIMTSDRTFLNSLNRYAIYSSSAEVAQDFGSNNIVTQFANIFFAQQPNPVNAGGELVIGYWRSSSETTPATSGYLLGGQIDELDVVSQLQQITDGSMTLDIDGTPVVLANLDFSVIDNMTDVVALLQPAILTAYVKYENQQLEFISNTTGTSSSVGFATGTGSGFVGNLLALTDGSGAESVDGVASAVLTAETEVQALTIVKSLINFKGFNFIDQSTDDDRYDIAVWAQANRTIGYDVFYNPAVFTRDTSISVPWRIKLAGLTSYRMLYSTVNNRKFATAYMSRNHTVNFSAQNSALTMNLKTLNGITPENYSQTIITNANIIGLDLYTTIKNVSVVLCAEGNDFVDNVYNLIAFIDTVATNAFNILKQTPTKVNQTTKGVNILVDSVEKTCDQYVNADVFNPGTWTSPTTFGDLNTFLRSIEQNGYYVLAGLLSNQPQPERQARKAPVIQVAVKNSGAIHHADIIINYNL